MFGCFAPLELFKPKNRVTFMALKGSRVKVSAYPWINQLSEEEIEKRMANQRLEKPFDEILRDHERASKIANAQNFVMQIVKNFTKRCLRKWREDIRKIQLMKNKAVKNMPESDHPSSSIVMVCNSPHGGGTHRVASILCNAWSRQGREVCLIALNKYEDVYHLDSSVRLIVASYLSTTSASVKFLRKIQSLLAKTLSLLKPLCPSLLHNKLSRLPDYLRILHRARTLRGAIQQTYAPVVIALGSYANILTILACKNLGRKVIISERNDIERRSLGYPWDGLRLCLYNQADVVTANSRGAI